MTRLFILFFLLIGSVHRSYSQGEFLLRGQSAFGGGAGLSLNREAHGVNLSVGYSYLGFLDTKLTYAKTSGGAVQGGVLTPSIMFYFAKQEDMENTPTFGLSLGFSHYMSKTQSTVFVPDTVIIASRLVEQITESTINALKIGVTAQRRIGYWKVVFFQPVLGMGITMKKAGWEFGLCGGLSMGTRIVHGPLLIFTPGIIRQSGVTTVLLTWSVVS